MKNVLTYHDEEIKGVASLIREREMPYVKSLDAKIEHYMDALKDFEVRCSMPDADREKLLDEITMLNDSILNACAEFEIAAAGDHNVIKEAQARFREKTQLVLAKSNFINHARTWPSGYQGDYKMLENAYRNAPASTGIGYYLDRYCLLTTLSIAVRERKAFLLDFLQAEMTAKNGLKILDIACGSCREVFELAPEIEKSGARVTCVDFDSEALDFAAKRMAFSGCTAEQTVYRKYNALKMINHARNLKEFGLHDLIYSVGFFDYLQDEVLVRLLGALYELLVPGGKLIASFKDCRNYGTQFYHWMVDWDGFAQRTREDCEVLLQKAGIPSGSIEFRRDRTKVIMFFIATK
jgi:SAM-dependent methyltransferase